MMCATVLVACLAGCTRPNDLFHVDPGGVDASLGPGAADLAGADLSATLDMSSLPSDLALGTQDLASRFDFASSNPGPDLAGVNFTGISCGAVTCAPGGACCVTPSLGGPTLSCVVGTSCPGLGIPLTCDGSEDCPAGMKSCCITIANSKTSGSSCTASCPASISNMGGGSVTTKLCHNSADCVGYVGTAPVVGATAFDRCCTTAGSGVHYCAPAFLTLTSNQITCD